MPLNPSNLAEDWKQWMLDANNPGAPVRPKSSFHGPDDRSYSLKDKKTRRFLQHEDQDWGINLGWTDDAEPKTERRVARWFFTRDGGGDGPIQYGETIAIGNGEQPSFIYYASRPFGINLKYSETPHFEWQILGGAPGAPKRGNVMTGDWIALFNEKSEKGEPFIYFDRTVGGDIGWPSSKTWGTIIGEFIEENAWKAAKDAAIAILAA